MSAAESKYCNKFFGDGSFVQGVHEEWDPNKALGLGESDYYGLLIGDGSRIIRISHDDFIAGGLKDAIPAIREVLDWLEAEMKK